MELFAYACACVSVLPMHTCTRAQTPSIGLISIGIFTFIGSLLGLCGAIRERRSLVCIYCCIIMLCILLQIGFGFAASQVASGNKPSAINLEHF